jgi:penicillin-binding protein A
MTRHIRRTAVFCLMLLAALVVNAARVQVFQADLYTGNPANRRSAITRWSLPRGDILVGGRPVTGDRDSGGRLRHERTYAAGPLYAPVTGFASQAYGTSLLEHTEDAVLSGRDPMLSVLPLWNDITGGRARGGDVVTTLNPLAQKAAYRRLAGHKGAVAAVEPATGRILALVSTPSYDPGDLSGNGRATVDTWRRLNADPDRPMLNRAVSQTYPPGSTFKVVTAAAALDAQVVDNPDTPTDSPDPYRLPGTTTRLTNESDGCRNASLRAAFERSCNTVFAQLGVRVGARRMIDTARAFGFNDDGLRIPFPVARSTFDTRLDQAQLALSSIGQYNTRATPLQMAMVAAAVANGGQLLPPYLVERTTTRNGTWLAGRPVVDAPVGRPGPHGLHQAMYPSTAMTLRRLMTGVVTDGTGANAAIHGATVGGKTGTAQHGVGNIGLPYAWFVSWAQRDHETEPAVAVAVVVEDAAADRGDISGGGAAAPIARAVMEAVLNSRPA